MYACYSYHGLYIFCRLVFVHSLTNFDIWTARGGHVVGSQFGRLRAPPGGPVSRSRTSLCKHAQHSRCPLLQLESIHLDHSTGSVSQCGFSPLCQSRHFLFLRISSSQKSGQLHSEERGCSCLWGKVIENKVKIPNFLTRESEDLFRGNPIRGRGVVVMKYSVQDFGQNVIMLDSQVAHNNLIWLF